MGSEFNVEENRRLVGECRNEIDRLLCMHQFAALQRYTESVESATFHLNKVLHTDFESDDSSLAPSSDNEQKSVRQVDELIHKMKRGHPKTMDLSCYNQLAKADKQRLEQAVRLYGYEISRPMAVSPPPPPLLPSPKTIIAGAVVAMGVAALVGWLFAKK